MFLFLKSQQLKLCNKASMIGIQKWFWVYLHNFDVKTSYFMTIITYKELKRICLDFFLTTNIYYKNFITNQYSFII